MNDPKSGGYMAEGPFMLREPQHERDTEAVERIRAFKLPFIGSAAS